MSGCKPMRCFSLQGLKNYLAIRKWKKAHQIDAHIQNINLHFKDINGYALSKKERETTPSLALTYGEINLESFLALLSLAKPNPDTIFYDLGCGLGKTVIACANVYKIKKAYGVEYLPELLNKAKSITSQHKNIEFIQEDILQTNGQDATMLFINVATFLPDTWQLICDKINQNPTQTVITCAKPIVDNTNWLIRETKVMTSWGIIPAYIHHLKL